MMDRYDYIHFTCAKLSDENGAASDKTPHPTSRGNKKQKTKKTPKLSGKEDKQMNIQEDMSNNVRQVAKSMHTQAYASISTHLQYLIRLGLRRLYFGVLHHARPRPHQSGTTCIRHY